jgi:serine/threonine-protein kinase
MLPERFGRYEVIDEIGDGAMGRVFRAWDPAVSRVVAVKTVKTEVLTRDTRDEFLRRFRREAQAAGGLNHPAIVRVFDLGDDYLVLEYIEGRTLHRLIRDEGRLAPPRALPLLAGLAEAVDHAHRAGIVHRDIKPANVMIQPDGQPKLMDFGVARIESSVMTTAGQILGSPSYMAPEQLAGQGVTSRAALYALAVVAYEMLTGQPPFTGDTITQVIYRVMHEPPPPPRRLNAALPARYDDVFSRALAKDPAERFATALEFVTALDLKELDLALPSPESSVAAPGVAVEDAPTLVSPARRAEAAPATPDWSRLALAGVGALAVAALAWMGLRAGASAPSGTGAPPPVPLAAATVTPPPTPAATEDPPVPPSRVKAARPPTPAPTPPPAVEGQLVELGPDVTPPVRVEGEPAPYPDAARRRGVRGTITVDMIVDETGLPTELQVVESAGPILDEAVLEAVRTWRFEPARKDGVRVKVRWRARQTYR